MIDALIKRVSVTYICYEIKFDVYSNPVYCNMQYFFFGEGGEDFLIQCSTISDCGNYDMLLSVCSCIICVIVLTVKFHVNPTITGPYHY
jgi:hypothetical protein